MGAAGKEIRNHFSPDAFLCDPAEPAYILQFRQQGLFAIEADNDIEAGIQAITAPDGDR